MLGGTELINLVGYEGKLFAGNGYWEDTSPPASGPQILVLTSPTGQWQQDVSFPGHTRVDSLAAITFTTDASGAPLNPPVSMLAAGVDGSLYTRADSGTWTRVSVPGAALTVRALAMHRDAVTGIDELFISEGEPDNTTPGAIYTAVYSPSSPGGVSVAPLPEFTNFLNRVMAFVEVNGRLLFAAKPGLYERTDGSPASWALVQSVPPVPNSVDNSGLRGLTVIGSSLFGGLEGNGGEIVRFDPNAGFAQSIDFTTGALLQQQWGSGLQQYIIPAYNNMPQVTDPSTGASDNLIGLQAHDPNLMTSAWYLVRSASGQYALHQVPALTSLAPLGFGRRARVVPLTLHIGSRASVVSGRLRRRLQAQPQHGMAVSRRPGDRAVGNGDAIVAGANSLERLEARAAADVVVLRKRAAPFGVTSDSD